MHRLTCQPALDPVDRVAEHAVADLPAGNIGTRCGDLAGDIETHDGRHRDLDPRHAAPGKNVVVIERGGTDPHHHVARARRRIGEVRLVAQSTRAMLAQYHSLHRKPRRAIPCRCPIENSACTGFRGGPFGENYPTTINCFRRQQNYSESSCADLIRHPRLCCDLSEAWMPTDQSPWAEGPRVEPGQEEIDDTISFPAGTANDLGQAATPRSLRGARRSARDNWSSRRGAPRAPRRIRSRPGAG